MKLKRILPLLLTLCLVAALLPVAASAASVEPVITGVTITGNPVSYNNGIYTIDGTNKSDPITMTITGSNLDKEWFLRYASGVNFPSHFFDGSGTAVSCCTFVADSFSDVIQPYKLWYEYQAADGEWVEKDIPNAPTLVYNDGLSDDQRMKITGVTIEETPGVKKINGVWIISPEAKIVRIKVTVDDIQKTPPKRNSVELPGATYFALQENMKEGNAFYYEAEAEWFHHSPSEQTIRFSNHGGYSVSNPQWQYGDKYQYVDPNAHWCTPSDMYWDTINHWHWGCTDSGCTNGNHEIAGLQAHVFTDAHDTTCEFCPYQRTAPAEHPATGDITNTPLWAALLLGGIALLWVQLEQRKRAQL